MVGPARNLAQALELADSAFDAAVLDIHLDRGERSLPAAARLRQREFLSCSQPRWIHRRSGLALRIRRCS